MMDTIERRQRAIRLWLYAVAALIFAIVLIGGATRLTESGLSIVEWKPVTGTLPPLSEAAWQAEFDKYKTIPQFTMQDYSNISHSRELNNISRVANLQVNATKERGAHSFKMGFTHTLRGWETFNDRRRSA